MRPSRCDRPSTAVSPPRPALRHGPLTGAHRPGSRCPSQPLCPGREFSPFRVLFAAYARESRCPRRASVRMKGGAGRGRDEATTRSAGRAARRRRHGTPGRGGLRRPRDQGGAALVGRARCRRLDGGSRGLDAAPGAADGPGRGASSHAVGLTCVITRFTRARRIGTWRSLVAHLTGGQGVAGSNPVVPTSEVAGRRSFPVDGSGLFAVLTASAPDPTNGSFDAICP